MITLNHILLNSKFVQNAQIKKNHQTQNVDDRDKSKKLHQYIICTELKSWKV